MCWLGCTNKRHPMPNLPLEFAPVVVAAALKSVKYIRANSREAKPGYTTRAFNESAQKMRFVRVTFMRGTLS